MVQKHTTKKTPQNTKTVQNGQAPATIQIDYERYAACLDDSDLDDDQKREFIDTLWSIITAFVDLGFGVHPVQHVDGDSAEAELSSAMAAVINSDWPKIITQKETGP